MKLVHERSLFVWLGIIGFFLSALVLLGTTFEMKRLLLQDTEEQLSHVANAAKHKLDGKTFDEILSLSNLTYYPQDYQIKYLGQTLQPLAESLSVNGVGVSFFDVERNSILTYAPYNLQQDLTPVPLPSDHPKWSVFETKQPSFQYVRDHWRGKVYLYTEPLVKNGHLFGLVGISIPKDSIMEKFKETALTNLYIHVTVFGVWILFLLVVYYRRQTGTRQHHLKNWGELLNLDEYDTLQLMQSQGIASHAADLFLEYIHMCRLVIRRILDHSSLGVLIVNGKFEVLYLNPKLERLSGYTLHEVNQMPTKDRLELFRPKNGERRITSLLYESPDSEIETEYILQTKQNEIISVEVHAFSMMSNNNIEAVVISVSDMREFDQFHRLETQTTLLLESMTEGVILLHADGTVTYMNRAFEDMLSSTREDWIGKNIFACKMEDSLRDNLKLVLAGRLSRIHATPAEFLNRQVTHFSIDLLALENPRSKVRGALLIGKDITTEWQWNELSKRADLTHSLSQMAASMAHEVRNPLTSIKGFLQLLAQNQPHSDKQTMYVQVMMDELERANSIITEYLNLSRSRTSLEQQIEHSLLRLLDDIRMLMESEAVIRGVNLHFYLTDVTIRCDPKKIKQVMINLIRNALEATPRGGSVIVSVKPCPEKNIVEIQVTDTGCGIAEEILPHIFTPFYSTKKIGTGLGLPVCKQIIEEHRGQIYAVSKQNEGSCFTIELPLPPAMDASEPAQE